MAAAEMTPSGVPPIPQRRSTGERSVTASSEAETSPWGIRRTRAPASRISLMASSWRGRSSITTITSPIVVPLRSATSCRVSGAGGRGRAGRRFRGAGHLHHVDAGTGVEHRAARGQRDDGERRGHAVRGERRALQRIDRDVDLGRGAVADALAVVEHRRLILLALADHHEAVHLHGLQRVAHAVDGGLVGGQLVAASHERRAGERGGLGDAHELQREVAIGR